MKTSTIPGGRSAALQALAAIDPERYTRSRNFLTGAVSRLSPYLRHGVLSLAEVRDHALANVKRAEHAEKFVNELAWRDYWQRLYAILGEGIWKDRESYKTGFAAASYKAELPQELIDGTTNLACMDAFSRDLRETGYLHNHARMWMAAYTVHWLRIRWQAGASWFLEHLLDGDPASNNLSWQWVASTFSHKPYFFNRENLERYTDGVYCRNCPVRDRCPFDASYEDLEVKLFPMLHTPVAEAPIAGPSLQQPRATPETNHQPQKPLVWVHTDALNPVAEVFTRFPAAPAVFIWDEPWLRDARISAKRVTFIEQCLAELSQSVQQRRGDPAAELLAAAAEAKAAGADGIVAMLTPDPRLLVAAGAVEATLPVTWIAPPRFVDDSRGFDLKRFSRYWQKAQASAMRAT